MKHIAASLVVGFLFAMSLHAGDPVVLVPLEAVDAEFEAIEAHDWEGSGWGVLGVPAEEVDQLLIEPKEASEWWDGRVLSLPPRKALMHRLANTPAIGDRLQISANLLVADATRREGRIMMHLVGRSAERNLVASSSPVVVDGDWRRVFVEIRIPSGWSTDSEPYLQIVNTGDTGVLIDKVSIARIATDEPGFKSLFNGTDLEGWTGNTQGYGVENGAIRTFPDRAGGNLYTSDEFDDFVFRFAFKVPPGANNGIAVRAPLTGDAAYEGMEIQILENSHPKYAGLKPWQFHGSVYGISPALRGYLAPPGEWNHEEIRAEGRTIRVILNGKVINEVDLDEALKDGALSGRPHPGAARLSGHLGFCGHGDVVHFADLRVRPLRETPRTPKRSGR